MKGNGWKGERGEWYVVLQLLLFALIFIAPFVSRAWSGWPAPWGQVAAVAGVLLLLVGGLLALLGLRSLGRNLTIVPRPKEDAELVERGAYGIVRHPIYSGIILGAVGWGLLFNSLLTLLLATMLFVLFDLKSRREELWLSEKYEGYAAYQQRVHKLLPWIY